MKNKPLCPVCNSLIKTYQRKYCSRECFSKTRTMMKNIRPCKICKKPVKMYTRIYCSRKCATNDPDVKRKRISKIIGRPHPIPQSVRDKISKTKKAQYKINPMSDEVKKKMSIARKGNLNSRWKGGEIKMGDYWYIWNPYHPRSNVRGYVKRAIVVAEKSLNRFLNQEEIIHHCNAIKSDDRPENLYIFENGVKHNAFHSKYSWNKKMPILKSNLFE